ncbi:MAG: MBOAT family protein [Acidobacteria bacterium]|nr:MBOAT family protein [Acidobacteriota bacterium]
MSFSEVEFFFFLPVLLVLYWLLPRRAGAQNAVLLVASYLFYASWHWKLLSLVIAGTLIDFVAGRVADAASGYSVRVRRIALTVSLLCGFGLLALFKYERFFASSANALLASIGLAPSVPLLELVLPLGISFYTLQRASYMLDVYWGRQSACRSLPHFALFSCYFPQLAAGPIARGHELLPQIAAPRSLSARNVGRGARLFLVGYVLKAFAANSIGDGWVDPVFGSTEALGALTHWMALVGFTLQVFGDFAGYSAMAIGVSRLFGIELPVNFDFPFLSKSLPELWRRWHISLNRWLFDYLFTPLSTSHGWFRGRVELALVITFLVSGLWHGAAWTFIIWGALHGFGMIAQGRWDAFYRGLCRKDRSYVKRRQATGYQFGAWAITMGFFLLTMIPFRSAGLARRATSASACSVCAARVRSSGAPTRCSRRS